MISFFYFILGFMNTFLYTNTIICVVNFYPIQFLAKQILHRPNLPILIKHNSEFYLLIYVIIMGIG